MLRRFGLVRDLAAWDAQSKPFKDVTSIIHNHTLLVLYLLSDTVRYLGTEAETVGDSRAGDGPKTHGGSSPNNGVKVFFKTRCRLVLK